MSSKFLILMFLLAIVALGLVEAYIVHTVANAPAPQQAVTTSASPDTQLLQLYRATAPGRKKINDAKLDILSAGEVVQQAGRDAGVELHIAGAVTPLVPGATPNKTDVTIDSTVIVVDAQGTLARLVHLVSLLETLPTPSVLQQFQLSRVGEGKAVKWQLSAQLKVFYTPDTATQ